MSKTIINQNPRPGASSSDLLWIQVVVSKSGGEPHMVRCFFGGIITCDCEGFGWHGKCSHQAQGKLQEAREALAAITVAAQPAPAAGDKAEIKRLGAAAFADLFGAGTVA